MPVRLTTEVKIGFEKYPNMYVQHTFCKQNDRIKWTSFLDVTLLKKNIAHCFPGKSVMPYPCSVYIKFGNRLQGFPG